MTPAINHAKRSGIDFRVHAYEHDPSIASYGEEACAKLGIGSDRVFKTLVVELGDKTLAVAVVPVSRQLDLKRFAKAAGSKKAAMADKRDVARVTGYVLGGVSPLGQKKSLITVVDGAAQAFETIYVSAGRRGLEIELAPQDLCKLTNAKFATIGK